MSHGYLAVFIKPKSVQLQFPADFPLNGLGHGLMKADGRVALKEKLAGLGPHVMEKILLRVAGVRAEMRGGKAPEPRLAGAAARKIEFL